jgi:hypothetical protein
MLALLVSGLAGMTRHRGRELVRKARRRSVRRVCKGCERQRALFREYGIGRWGRYHTLCFRCLRTFVDQCQS